MVFWSTRSKTGSLLDVGWGGEAGGWRPGGWAVERKRGGASGTVWRLRCWILDSNSAILAVNWRDRSEMGSAFLKNPIAGGQRRNNNATNMAAPNKTSGQVMARPILHNSNKSASGGKS